MKTIKYFTILIALIVSGCSSATEIGRTVWGTSTRALEEARIEAISDSYQCSFDDCFDAILSLDRKEKAKVYSYTEAEYEFEPGVYDVFLKDRIRSVIIVMGIEGNVDTTEVGIFLSRDGRDAYRIEISSLSSSAKRKVAQWVFDELDNQFTKKE